MWILEKIHSLNSKQEMDFALWPKAQTADENQSGFTLKKKSLGTYLFSTFLIN